MGVIRCFDMASFVVDDAIDKYVCTTVAFDADKYQNALVVCGALDDYIENNEGCTSITVSVDEDTLALEVKLSAVGFLFLQDESQMFYDYISKADSFSFESTEAGTVTLTVIFNNIFYEVNDIE